MTTCCGNLHLLFPVYVFMSHLLRVYEAALFTYISAAYVGL